VRISNRNSSGFTLIEVMVAIVIMMVGLLGLLQSINVAMEFNLKNHMRDEAVYVGERYLNELKGKGFGNISASYSTLTVKSRIRGEKGSLTVDRSSTDMGSSTKRLQVLVKWKYKGVEYENRVVAPISTSQ